MERSYIEELKLTNYGCIRDATVKLTPLHALIGPNDSGKSTILRALQTMGLLAAGHDLKKHDARFAALLRAGEEETVALEITSSSFRWRVWGEHARFHESLGTTWSSENDGRVFYLQNGSKLLKEMEGEKLKSAVNGAHLLRLDPDALREPSELLAEDEPVRLDERGKGLAAVYDAILSRDVQGFLAIGNRVSKLFPFVKAIALRNVSKTMKAMEIQLLDGARVDAARMSEGLLYYLAFAALQHLQVEGFLLVEEPENGLHPSRIADVIGVLRKISETRQVIIATHSPLVINELRPDEVSVVTRTAEHGTRVVPIAETPNFEERSKVYALGELWLSYANGKDESPLLQGGPAA